jgi:TPR repeat protein
MEAKPEPRWSPRGIMGMSLMFPLAVGPGAPHSYEDKVRVLKVAAGRDGGKSSGVAWLKLGHCYHYGQGVEQDYRHALECYENAAKCENSRGALAAGLLLVNGAERPDGTGFKIRRNRAKALSYYEKAAAGSPPVPEARARLAEYYVRRSLSIILASSCLLAPFTLGACFDPFYRR